jgi:sarcosine/dimethylglycine N-methyltransferase
MSPRTTGPQSLVDLYAQHPLREETILARVQRQRGSLDGVTELDLAHDSVTEITDQNHVGGVAAVVQLAVRAAIDPRSRVLDAGAGLGGSARCLAHLFGCRVDGVELSPLRAADAENLTRRVQLEALVASICGDVLSVELPSRHYDVVWGQGAWMHLADPAAFFARAAAALVANGRIAFEDACLLDAPRSEPDARLVEDLARLWGGRFMTRDAWHAALGASGFEVVTTDDLTHDFVTHFRRLIAIARSHGSSLYPAHETEAFEHAIRLAGSGVIGYARFVAQLNSPAGTVA